jgi:ketosteroid isomerase-like protein
MEHDECIASGKVGCGEITKTGPKPGSSDLYNFKDRHCNSFVKNYSTMKRNNILRLTRLAGILCLFYSCNAHQSKEKSDPEEAKKEIAESNAVYFQAFAKGGSSIFINRYAKDCWIMPPNAPALHGADAPLKFFKTAYIKFGLRNGKFITIDVFGDGKEFVTEVGYWQSFDAHNTLFDNGKFVVLWKKTPDGWKMFRDSFSSDRYKNQ